jgi:hypothetical protein
MSPTYCQMKIKILRLITKIEFRTSRIVCSVMIKISICLQKEIHEIQKNYYVYVFIFISNTRV